MYRVNLNESPLTILALWDGQEVIVDGVRMIFCVEATHPDRVYLTTCHDRGLAYSAAYFNYMNGVVGYTRKLPIYSEFCQHVREGRHPNGIASANFLSREHLMRVIQANEYHIG